jgi:selenocysteine lyase/cysteine desulfurase
MRGARWNEANEFAVVADAKRFENWEFAYALVLGLGAAARYAMRVGVEESSRYAWELAQYTRDRLAAMPNARVLDQGANRCAIVTVHFPGHDAREIMQTLREEAINTTATLREYAVLDMDRKRVPDALRISPHYYNTRRDIDVAMSALRAWGAGQA